MHLNMLAIAFNRILRLRANVIEMGSKYTLHLDGTVSVLLHPLERRCVLSLASGNFALYNEHVSLKGATILLNLAVKRGNNYLRTVNTTTNLYPPSAL